jgi:hypothetical protein
MAMIKNAERIDYDINSEPLSKDESHRLSQTIGDYKKRKKAKRKKTSSRKKASL